MISDFIFVHLPKTAGSTLASIFVNVYGKENVARDTEKLWKDIYTDKNLYDYKSIIYGHFSVDKYKYLNRPMITLLRDPAQRVISQYYYCSKPYDIPDDISLIDYAKHPRCRNMATKQLKSLKNFSFIGIQEKFEESMDRLSSWLGVEFPEKYSSKRVNTKHKQPVSYKDKKYIRKLNKLDYRLYKQVLKRY